MECGIIGLPGSGKTCLFTALTGSPAVHSGGSNRPNIAVAAIPDPRLTVIAGYIEPRAVTPASITFVDIPGNDPGAGATKSGPLLAHVRQVDAICEVVRCYDGTDAQRDVIRLEEELVLADMAVVEPALDKARRTARTGLAEAKAKVAALEKASAVLGEARPIRTVTDFTPGEDAIVRGLGLITAKRMLYVANVSEDDLAGESSSARAVRDFAAANDGEAVVLCALLESELAELDEADRDEMLEGMGLSEPAIGPLARGVCRLLGLRTFYTVGEKEVRAWTVSETATAPEAAGVIHTDMQRGFIRAECYHVDDLVELHDEKSIKAAGRLRTEGKSYHVRDGDIMHMLFNV
ncbi:MAG: redox-regulated ATPase YchF [Planctomycetes bacterium]|nr:redox-regulated ATPase YchF [Planctomycetota bacterium]